MRLDRSPDETGRQKSHKNDHRSWNKTWLNSVALETLGKIENLPLNIWKLEAYVISSPIYISEVATMSNIAGRKNKNGLKFWLPRIVSTSSTIT